MSVATGTLTVSKGIVVEYALSEPVSHRLDGFTEAAALEILAQYGWEKVVSDALPFEDHTTRVEYRGDLSDSRPRIFKSELT
jgi:hypothetical protein